jgi:hypothetical protein
MSEEGDLARDLRLADALGRLPAPALPAGLADRIARNATRLPQLPEPIELPDTAVEPPAPPVEGKHLSIRRWLPYAAVGAAIAATVAVALLQPPREPERPSTAQVAQSRPVAPAAPAAALAPVLAEAQEPARAATEPVPKPVVGSKSIRARIPHGGVSRLAKDDSSDTPSVPAPLEVPPTVAVTAPEARPAGQANMGPPDLDDVGAPMTQRGGGAEFGITGTSGPDLPGPSPAPRGQPGGKSAPGMPRF